MPNLHSRTRRVVVAGGFAIAIAAAPAAAFLGTGSATPTPLAACPAGEVEDIYTDACIPELSPNVAGGAHPTHTPAPGGFGPDLNPDPCFGAAVGSECLQYQGGDAIGDKQRER